ncbi:FtsX-like permease family protein [Rugosimonospora africana]|uniref:ABC3 transporter permease C-terminal domain-containing protein n=1 Tax=Rugosimonospora africana TaxID=556532 RepID=A0A8J3VVE1_9ACTN|nr:ABC transporter permease [Rugosimonospora africana]GIH19839.1 hypothetical protein Raf01_80110 [Rugosimonospora africana]
MIGQLLTQLRRQPARAVALLLAVTAATAAFTVLTGRAATERLELRGQAESAPHGSYDILVRPAGTRTPLERSEHLVRADFLAGQFGGITTGQDQTIAKLPGVQVAAPIAMIGYVLQTVSVPIDITDQIDPGARQLFVASARRSTDRGLTTIDRPGVSYTYVTPDTLRLTSPATGRGDYGTVETDAAGHSTLVCPASTTQVAGPFAPANLRTAACWSTRNGLDGAGWQSLPAGHVGVVLRWTFPFLLAAIDPQQESRLVGMDRAVTAGAYLPEGVTGNPAGIPVLVADRAGIDDQDQVSISRLPADAAASYAAGLPPAQIAALMQERSGVPVRTTTVTASQAYQRMLAQYLAGARQTVVDSYWTAGPTSYDSGPDGVLRPKAVTNPDQVWRSDLRDQGFVDPPPEAADTAFRGLRVHTAIASRRQTDQAAPQLTTIGTFDPTRVDVGGDQVLDALDAATLTGADNRSRALLGGGNLLPNSDIAGYSLSTPTMLTSLSSIGAFSDPATFTDVRPGAPISAIRVRVAGVTGNDALSRERVRTVADAIHQATGLDVDITLGSSPTTVTVALPAGAAGRPALLLSEQWQREGVVTTVLQAVDRQSLLLFALVLVVCGLFVANATAASVRARRRELAVLSCLGWTRGQLLRLLLYEIALIGGLAGLAGMLLSVAAGHAFGVSVTPLRAAAALPAALLVSLLAALWPAWRASAPPPLFTMHHVREGGPAASHGRSLSRMAAANLVRVPGRTALGLAAVAVGTAGLTLLVAITLTFRGSLVGSVLGTAISLRARSVDYLAVAVAVLLAALAVADVIYLNMRDRYPELAVLYATGWTPTELWRLILLEAGLTAMAGAGLGGVIGLSVAAVFAGSVPLRLLAVTGATVVASAGVTVLATLVPTRALRRIPVALLLSRD